MPCYIRVLTPDGLQPVDYTAESLADAARYEPREGVYTITNTFNAFQVLKPDAHFDRLENSAERASIPLRLDRARLRAALRQMISEANYGDVRFRITVPAAQSDHLILSLEPFMPLPREVYSTGERCVTVSDAARTQPNAKTTDWMHDRARIETSLPTHIFTALLLDDAGNILEGLSSNFYAVLGGELRTAGQGVLPGIAQQVVFEIATVILPVRKDAVHLSEIPTLDEAFITSASRGIVPVVEIDSIQIGDGTPGPQTKALREAYLAWVAAHLEEL
jgi:branched-chain amino acid aminotransferase